MGAPLAEAEAEAAAAEEEGEAEAPARVGRTLSPAVARSEPEVAR
ncbi:MAG TPA: hypothetical protein VHT75_14060 [Acidimicrobiales bacterium]|jgi:hypothetical protein|nr:hypothetical protein [Acidimicrobiales bacterium]